jgi:SAM-dependent methyltransferase
VHWMAKAAVQSVLARIPYGEQINHRFQRSSAAEKESRMNGVTGSIEYLTQHKRIDGAVIVEVGTGWDALPTLALSAHGAARIHTYDHLPHLRLARAREAALALLVRMPANKRLKAMIDAPSIEQFLAAGHISYAAPADATKTALPDSSIDIYFSYAVLEHVSESVIDASMAEARRILKPDGVFFAVIGLHDHYVGMNGASKVNFLQYPEWMWALLVKNKFSYHNRLRERDFLERLREHKARILDVQSVIDPADLEQVQRMKIDRRFEGYAPEELAVHKTEVVANFALQ